LFEIVKLARRLPGRPCVVGSLARLAGFAVASGRGETRPVSREFLLFLRKDQKSKLRVWLSNMFRMVALERSREAFIYKPNGVAKDAQKL
jgi:hypothetical protein